MTSLSQILYKLQKEGKTLTLVDIYVKDKKYTVHKEILAANSQFFDNLFSDKFKTDRYELLEDIFNEEIMDFIIKYFYDVEIDNDVTLDNFTLLMKAVDYLDISTDFLKNLKIKSKKVLKITKEGFFESEGFKNNPINIFEPTSKKFDSWDEQVNKIRKYILTYMIQHDCISGHPIISKDIKNGVKIISIFGKEFLHKRILKDIDVTEIIDEHIKKIIVKDYLEKVLVQSKGDEDCVIDDLFDKDDDDFSEE